MAGCRILQQPAMHQLIDSGRLKGSLRRAHARPQPAKPPTRISKEAHLQKTNEYRCPAGERLIWRFSTIERGLKISKYWSSNCQQCPLKENCTPSPQRRVARWEHEAVLEDMQTRLDHAPAVSRMKCNSGFSV
jgi:hypothetical protein